MGIDIATDRPLRRRDLSEKVKFSGTVRLPRSGTIVQGKNSFPALELLLKGSKNKGVHYLLSGKESALPPIVGGNYVKGLGKLEEDGYVSVIGLEVREWIGGGTIATYEPLPLRTLKDPGIDD